MGFDPNKKFRYTLTAKIATEEEEAIVTAKLKKELRAYIKREIPEKYQPKIEFRYGKGPWYHADNFSCCKRIIGVGIEYMR